MEQPRPGLAINSQVRLIEPLATGGMSSIWIGHHQGLDSRVAVKFLEPELAAHDASLAQRLRREARISAQVRSPHAVQTFDHGVMEGGLPYIVMELLEGIDLARALSSAGPLPLDQCAELVGQVATVLHLAHGLGILHRDIKPDNIFLVESPSELFVKVLDFGVAKQKRASRGDSVVTRAGTILGTIEFMSPEQAAGSSDLDHRTDLFSLGVVAYFALCGELPFEPTEASPLWQQWCNGPRAITELRPELPLGLIAWFHTALALDREARFQSALAMSHALNAITDAMPDAVTLPPPPPAGRS